jgi:hypothetical protein
MTDEQELHRQREIARTNAAYQRLFAGDDGQVVLQNLRAYFRADRPAFERSMQHSYCPIAAALRDGQREVILFIEHKISSPRTDDDITDNKSRVLR